jgi:hypothetical protein
MKLERPTAWRPIFGKHFGSNLHEWCYLGVNDQFEMSLYQALRLADKKEPMRLRY